MIDQAGSTFRLRRSPAGRLFAGSPAQWVLTVVLLLDIALIALVSSAGSPATVLPAAAPGVVILVIWLLGVGASARADADGVRWRYYLAHHHRWNEIEQVRFGGRRTGPSVQAAQAAILIKVGSREHPITPAYGCGRWRLVEFGDALIALAEAHQVPVSVDPADERWAGLRPS